MEQKTAISGPGIRPDLSVLCSKAREKGAQHWEGVKAAYSEEMIENFFSKSRPYNIFNKWNKPEVKQHTVELYIVESQSEINPDNIFVIPWKKNKKTNPILIYEDIAPHNLTNVFPALASTDPGQSVRFSSANFTK